MTNKPGIQQCQAQGLVFCPRFGLIQDTHVVRSVSNSYELVQIRDQEHSLRSWVTIGAAQGAQVTMSARETEGRASGSRGTQHTIIGYLFVQN